MSVKKVFTNLSLISFAALMLMFVTKPAFATPPVHQIYENTQLDNGWTKHDYYGNSTTLNSTNWYHSPSEGMRVFHGGTYATVRFINDGNVDATKYYRMIMYVTGAGTTGQQPTFMMLPGDGSSGHGLPLTNFIEGGSFPEYTWAKTTIPFGALQSADKPLVEFALLNPGYYGGMNVYYVDDIQFVCKGDANADNVVSISDVSIYSSEYNSSCTGYSCKADFNQDAVVDSNDYTILLSKFGTACE